MVLLARKQEEEAQAAAAVAAAEAAQAEANEAAEVRPKSEAGVAEAEAKSMAKSAKRKRKRGSSKKRALVTTSGPLLLTHTGVSGPAALRLSAFGARLLADSKYKGSLTVNWCEL